MTVELRGPGGQGQGNVVGQKEVTRYTGLLARAHEEGLGRITTDPLQLPSQDNGMVAVVRVEVETHERDPSPGSGMRPALCDVASSSRDVDTADIGNSIGRLIHQQTMAEKQRPARVSVGVRR